jgi:hypothetical protein
MGEDQAGHVLDADRVAAEVGELCRIFVNCSIVWTGLVV